MSAPALPPVSVRVFGPLPEWDWPPNPRYSPYLLLTLHTGHVFRYWISADTQAESYKNVPLWHDYFGFDTPFPHPLPFILPAATDD